MSQADQYVRELERRVITGDFKAVAELARAYERLGRGESLKEVLLRLPDGTRTSVLVAEDHPLAAFNQLLDVTRSGPELVDAPPQERPLRENQARAFAERLARLGYAAAYEYPGFVEVVMGRHHRLAIGVDGEDYVANLLDRDGRVIRVWSLSGASIDHQDLDPGGAAFSWALGAIENATALMRRPRGRSS